MNWNEYLKTDFESRKSKNSKYSLRSYAKLLGISPAHLSLILSDKRRLKAKSALKISKSLGMTSTETLTLLEGDSRSANRYYSVQTRVLNNEEFSLISGWQYYAILGLANLQPNVADANWIAKRLKIPLSIAKKSFNELVRLGYIKISGAQFIQATDYLRTTDDVPSEQIRSFHKQNLQLAAEKIDQIEVDSREYTSMTIPMNLARLSEAKEMIRQFKEDFTKEMSQGKRSEVYSFNIQFFPLTELLR